MFELLEMKLYKKESKIKAFFSFVYDGFVVRNATLYIDDNNELQIGMPKSEYNNKKRRTVCYFKNKNDIEPLKYLVLGKYNQLISKKSNFI